MASQPSVHSEDRNLLRLRAWEQRTQETSQTKEINPENVPLFGEPYKTNKGDELSNRIQRMLGSYEDVNNPYPFSIEALPIPTCASFSQSSHCPLNSDKSTTTTTPFHNQSLYTSTQTQNETSGTGYSSQLTRMSSLNHSEHSSTFAKSSLNLSQFSHSGQQQKESEILSDLGGFVGLHQEMSVQSPDATSLPLPHSADHNIDMDTKDTLNRLQLQGSADYSSECSSAMDVSTLNIKHPPKDASLPQAKTHSLPSQTFPSLLSSKQPGIVMTQKPTAYVRPMDGQDQVVNESPELKLSPEHYAPLPELISKSGLAKTKIMPQFMETVPEEPHCVEDILREMTHSWPPLLTEVHTPSSDELSKAPFLAKEPEHISSCSEQKSQNFSPTEPSHFSQQSSSVSFEAAHSSDAELVSSSDSESSRGSESDSESSTVEPPPPSEGNLVKTELDAPSLSHGAWQLGNWIKSGQQTSSTGSRDDPGVSESPAQKQLLSCQTPKQTCVNTSRESKLSSQQKQFTGDLTVQQRGGKNSQTCQRRCKKSLSTDVGSCSDSKKVLKRAKTSCSDLTQTTISVKSEDAANTQTRESSFTDRPKVKTKTGSHKKDSSGAKRDLKRTKRTKSDKQKVGSEATLMLNGRCPSCGVSYSNPCSCPTQSPALPAPQSLTPPVQMNCSKTKTETLCQSSSTKVTNKPTHKTSEKLEHAVKGTWDHFQPPRSLLVKINLCLLMRVPQTAGSIHTRISSKAKRPALVLEQDEGSNDVSKTHKRTKTSKKRQKTEEENKTLPKKKWKLENKNTSSACSSVEVEKSIKSAEVPLQNKAKKHFQKPATSKDAFKTLKAQCQQSNKEAVKGKDSIKHKNSGKPLQHTRKEKKKPLMKSLPLPATSQLLREASSCRPLITFDEKPYPVKHYIKEAKRLKHKADAELDKLNKAFNYLDAAMFFVESGIAMEKDPQISTSSYTMFAETVELLKFVLKLKNPVDSSAPLSEKDFLALCLKCQSLLQMAMFHHKRKAALKLSKTLSDHFTSPAQALNPLSSSKMAENPPTLMSSPVSTSTSSSGVGSFGTTVSLPQEMEQMAFSYVNITTLFLSAHDIWEQAEELAHRGSGVLAELDSVLGPLSLTSSMSSMVRYTRQGVHWLRQDSQKV
uniref:AF4/FMR2 family, member 1 n=2 Tax=Iconisemion striatum TaxID=60296 RepID=A0A1A7XSM5_9TELE